MIKTGQRYVGPSGMEIVVTKGGEGELSDGSTPLYLKGEEIDSDPKDIDETAIDMPLGKRFTSSDGSISVLVTKAGKCNLLMNGEPMELQEPKKLPSSD
ncbi:MAG: hypothetical protein ACJ0KI_05630 [Dehalococcoidia bacterium]|tara:strand:- start:537 stop:833 length:297 start_codon:yes stop_codon:yes gene_type:complete